VGLILAHAQENNHLACYTGMLLLNDSLRASHKQSLERFLLDNDARDAEALSTRALLAIGEMAERLAVRDPQQPITSSVLAFHALLWNHKKTLEREATE
jgi:hypothetical protein